MSQTSVITKNVEAQSTMNTLVLCSAALVLLFAVLSFNVSRVKLKRRKHPEVTEAEVTKAIRAHGNAAEYIPLFVGLFLYLNSTQPSRAPTWSGSRCSQR